MYKLAPALALGVVVFASQDTGFTPARLRDGRCPDTPIAAVSGGEVFVELDVDAEGTVARVNPLRATPPFTDFVLEAVRNWRFFPARDVVDEAAAKAGKPTARIPVPSGVLVAAVFRSPTIIGPTLGDPPKDVAPGSDAIPVPIATTTPGFPPMTLSSGTVTLEVRVDASGGIADAGVIQSAPPFDQSALEAIRAWRFRPARAHGEAVESVAYVIFGFRMPIGGFDAGPLVRPPVLKPD